MPLHLGLSGYRDVSGALTIDDIGDEIIGPQAARRYLREELADTVSLPGPVVVVRARLPSPTFVSDEGTYEFHDGMQGTAAVRLRSESILVALLPGFRALFGKHDG